MTKLVANLSVLFSQPTGISNYATNLIKYLKTLNPTLLTPHKYPGFDCYQIPGNLSPEQGTKGHIRRLLWTQFQLATIFQKCQGNLLFSPLPEAPLYNQGCPYVVMVHDFIPLRFPQDSLPQTLYYRYYVPQVLQQSQQVICNSIATARDVVKFTKISAHKVTPIHLGYDEDNFRPLNSLTNNSDPYFLYIGRHNPHKNVSRLIAAFAKINNYSDYALWLVGSPDKRYTPQLKLQVKELNLQGKVKFLDYISYQQLPIIINNAIALVFPSLWEGFGLPVLEAMACGTPVITSNIASLPEVAGDAAVLIDPYNTVEITAAMETIIQDENRRSQLSTLGLERAKQFSWAKTGRDTVEVLQKYI